MVCTHRVCAQTAQTTHPGSCRAVVYLCLLRPRMARALCWAAGDAAEPTQAAQKAVAAGKGSAGLLSSALAPALRVRSAETWVEWALPGLGPRLGPIMEWPCATRQGRGAAC